MNTSHRGHYIKGSGRGYLPGRIVTVVVETTAETHASPHAVTRLNRFRAVHVAESHRRSARYSAPSQQTFGSVDALWDWLERPGLARRRVLAFSPVASDSLTLLRLWDRWDVQGARWSASRTTEETVGNAAGLSPQYIVHKRVCRGSPDIIEYSKNGRRFRWCSCRNYFKDCERDVSASVGYKWRTLAELDESPNCITARPMDHCLMWHHAICELVYWWKEMKAGYFPATMPGMGLAYLKSRIPREGLCTHKNPDALTLERRCCHGGRATAFFVGDVRPDGRYTSAESIPIPSARSATISGPIHLIDVRSMYPTLMRDHTFPIKIAGTAIDPPVKDVAVMLTAYHVLARVTLRTEVPEYPYRSTDRVFYPVGRFLSYLSTPELSLAISEGSVERVHYAVYYYRGKPFERAATDMLAMRQAAKDDKRTAWESFIKGMTNSSTGKLAQRKGEWVPRPDIVAATGWGEWLDYDCTTGTKSRFRSLALLVEQLDKQERGTGTMTACYAVLTAIGRCLMRSLRSKCPPRSVISQDTDGLWVTDAGLSAIIPEDVPSPAQPGSIRLVQSVSSARFWDSKHYYAGGNWVLSGIHNPVWVAGTASFASSVVANPIRNSPLAPPDAVAETDIVKTLEFSPADGVVGQDGWIEPYRLPTPLYKSPPTVPVVQPLLFPDD